MAALQSPGPPCAPEPLQAEWGESFSSYACVQEHGHIHAYTHATAGALCSQKSRFLWTQTCGSWEGLESAPGLRPELLPGTKVGTPSSSLQPQPPLGAEAHVSDVEMEASGFSGPPGFCLHASSVLSLCDLVSGPSWASCFPAVSLSLQ